MSDNPWDMVKHATVLSDYIASHSPGRRPMKPQGRKGHFMGFCPLHDNTRTPALSINDELGVWKCFAGCGGGSIIDFWLAQHGMEQTKKNAWTAVQALARELGVDIDDSTQDFLSDSRIIDALTRGFTNAHEFLLTSDSPDAERAWTYVESRGLLRDDEASGMGFLPPGRRGVKVLSRGVDERALVAGGVLTESSWSMFSGRLVIPIRSGDGSIIALAGREIPEVSCSKPGVKWVNPPDTQVFHKRRNLYGQHVCKPDARGVVVEGYFDADAVSDTTGEVGLAVCGTTMTPEHLSILSRCRGVTLMFDGDEAGYKALLRSLWVVDHVDDVSAVILDDDDPADLACRGASIPTRGVDVLQAVVEVADRLGGDRAGFDRLISRACGQVSGRATRAALVECAANHVGESTSRLTRTLTLPGQDHPTSTRATPRPELSLCAWLLGQSDEVRGAIAATLAHVDCGTVVRVLFPDATTETLATTCALLTCDVDAYRQVGSLPHLDEDVNIRALLASMMLSVSMWASTVDMGTGEALRIPRVAAWVQDGHTDPASALLVILDTCVGLI